MADIYDEELSFDYQEDALSLLLPQFDDSRNLRALLKGWLAPTIEWQRAVKELYSAYDLFGEYDSTTRSKQLELLGKLLNVERRGDDDPTLQYRIISQIAINNADGTGDSFYTLLRLILGENIRFDFTESYGLPHVNVNVYGGQTRLTRDVVEALLPLGVFTNFITTENEDAIIFYPVEVRNDGSHEDDFIDPERSAVLPEVGNLGGYIFGETEYFSG